MLKKLFAVAMCAFAFHTPTATAETTGEELARLRNCLACHQIDKKRVGPSFTAIGERFAGADGAVAYLATAIRNGGQGRWGPIPMPAQPQVNELDAERLAAWILTLGGDSTDASD